MSIPALLVQTWKTRKPPENWKGYVHTLQKLHPCWEYKCYSDEDNEEFMQVKYPQYYRQWKKLPYNINRIDVIRYLYLYEHGGFYLDMDMQPIRPLTDLRDHTIVCACFFGCSYYLECAFIGSVPKHVFWLILVERIFQYQHELSLIRFAMSTWKITEILNSTGPLMLGRVYHENQNKFHNDFTILPMESFYSCWIHDVLSGPSDKKIYAIHQGAGTWYNKNDSKFSVILIVLTVVIVFVIAIFWMYRK